MKAALDALKRIKMPAIADKPLRNGIINTHLALLREQRRFEKELADLETAHLGAFKDEREALAKLQREMSAEKDAAKREAIAEKINGFTALYDAWEGYQKAVEELAKQTVEVAGIPQDAFVAEIQKQDFDLAQIEALYPLFIEANETKTKKK